MKNSTPFRDPQYMTDEELFLHIKPELNIKSKEKLFEYFRGRTNNMKHETLRVDKRWLEMISDEYYQLQDPGYFLGDFQVGAERHEYTADIRAAYAKPQSTISISLRAWYNEESHMYYEPDSVKLELIVNGSEIVIPVSESAMIRAGKYRNTNYKDFAEPYVQTFGEFLGDNTAYAILKFSLNELSENDSITNVKLKISAYSECTKRMILLKEPTNTWERTTAVWNDFPGYVYSFNGIGNTWSKPDGADIEYLWQASRFTAWSFFGIYYDETGDEEMALKAQKMVENFINVTGGWKSSSTWCTYDENGIRGGFTRSLDAAIRIHNISKSFDSLIKSKSATPDFCSALLKNLWDTMNYLIHYNTAAGNWRQHEFTCLLNVCKVFSEFKESDEWAAISRRELENIIYLNSFPDGSYKEATAGYSMGAFTDFLNYKRSSQHVSPEYDEMLRKSAYYNCMLYAPDGTSIQYGDCGAGKGNNSAFLEVCDMLNDEELRYICTHGSKGACPPFTSYHFKDSAVTFMRNDWSEESPYLFTNVRGGGQHGHADDNAIVLFAYGRILLSDSGIFTYTHTNPYRKWALSSAAHNTVVINDCSQLEEKRIGIIEGIKLTDKYDYLSQTTYQNKGFSHNRKIYYNKPDTFLVVDTLIPDDNDKPNTYKQIWHMLPQSDIAADAEHNAIRSNYKTGPNVELISLDNAASVGLADGWYDKSYQQLEQSRYGYFMLENIRGAVSMSALIRIIR